MEGIFDVTRGGQVVGTVQIKREGLYCRVVCRCGMDDGKIHRLYASGEKIGVLIPDREGLILETRVAAKRLKEGCVYTLDEKTENFIPIRPGEPFEYLDKVRSAKLAVRHGEPGLILDC